MTETSGYNHSWTGGPCTSDATSTCSGAFDLAQAIYSGLYYGHMTAWLYWQGSDGTKSTDLNEYSLMAGPTNPGKNYYISKQYYRYIRPGAQMVDVKSSDPNVLVVAFDHAQMGAFTIVAINTGTAATPLTITGNNLPSSYNAIRTSKSENAVDLGTVSAGNITLPPSSITTLVNGNYLEAQGATVDAGAEIDAGGNVGAGGAIGTGGTSGSGGATGSGGKSDAGGVTQSGGAIGFGGTTGKGGASGSGGALNSGGAPGSGGTAAVGGALSVGGVPSSGGATGRGGALGSGGASGSGGALSSGGVTRNGGASGSGGATGSGGASGSGGATGSGGSTTSAGSSSGCSCNVNGAPFGSNSGAILTLAGLVALIVLRRRRR